MHVLRLIITLIFVVLVSCSEQNKSKTVTGGVNDVSDICISINDFGKCFKSICIDSSGFYYLYCDTIQQVDTSFITKRVDLSEYKAELQLIKTLDSTYFVQLYQCIDTSCAIGKEPFTVFIRQGGREYIAHPGSYADCDTASCFYKMQLIRDFFKTLKRDFPTKL